MNGWAFGKSRSTSLWRLDDSDGMADSVNEVDSVVLNWD